MQTMTSTLNNRDRAVLRAVAAGRCEIPAGSGGGAPSEGVNGPSSYGEDPKHSDNAKVGNSIHMSRKLQRSARLPVAGPIPARRQEAGHDR